MMFALRVENTFMEPTIMKTAYKPLAILLAVFILLLVTIYGIAAAIA